MTPRFDSKILVNNTCTCYKRNNSLAYRENENKTNASESIVLVIAITLALIVWSAMSAQGIHLRGCRSKANAAHMFGWNFLNAIFGGLIGMPLFFKPDLF